MHYVDLDTVTDIIADLNKNRERIISIVVAYEVGAGNGADTDTIYSFGGGCNAAIGLCETAKKDLLEDAKNN